MQVTSYTMYTAIPEISMSEWNYVWCNTISFKCIKNLFVVIKHHDIFWIDDQHVYIKHCFFYISGPMTQPLVYNINDILIVFKSWDPPFAFVFSLQVKNEGLPFPGKSNRQVFSNTTIPSAKSWLGEDTKLTLVNIRETNGEISFQVIGPKEPQAEESGGFDYPIGNRGYLNSITACIPQQINPEYNPLFLSADLSSTDMIASVDRGASGKSDWYVSSDAGNFAPKGVPSHAGLHPAEDWNLGPNATSDVGQPVYAVANGEVWQIRPTTSGNLVVLKHTMTDGHIYYSIYQHITAVYYNGVPNASGVCVGDDKMGYSLHDYFTKGMQIGRIASGPNHLHFEIRDGSYIELFTPSGSKNTQGFTGIGIYPLGQSNGYYTSSKSTSWDNITNAANLQSKDLQAAVENMKKDGIVDPSDFIESHRPVVYPINGGAEIYGGSPSDPLKDIRIIFSIPQKSFQVTDAKINGASIYSKASFGMISFMGGGYYNTMMDLSKTKDLISYENKTYDLEITLTNNVTLLGKINFCDPNGFTDVSDWLKSYVKALAEKGIVKGSMSGNNLLFSPDNYMTRGQAAKVLVTSAFELNLRTNAYPDLTHLINLSGQRFTDVDAENAFFPYVQTLRNWKTLKNEPCISTANSKFNYNSNITIAQFAKILCNVFNLTEADENTGSLKNGGVIGSSVKLINSPTNDLVAFVNIISNILVTDLETEIPELLITSFKDLTQEDLLSSVIEINCDALVKRSMMAKVIANAYGYKLNKAKNRTTAPTEVMAIADSTGVGSSALISGLGSYTIIGDKFELNNINSGTEIDEPLTSKVRMKSGEIRTFDFLKDSWDGAPMFFYWALDNGEMESLRANHRAVKVTAPSGITEPLTIRLYSFRGTALGNSAETYFNILVEPSGPAVVTKLTPDFAANITDGRGPLPVQFSNTTRIPAGTSQVSYLWNFGDGSTANDPSPAHTYLQPGTYTVSLTATSSSENIKTIKTGFITVVDYNASASLVAVEYYFDSDPGVGKGTLLSSASQPYLVATNNIDISGLTTGLHTIYFRAKDNMGVWGAPQLRPFLVTDDDTGSPVHELASAEYFLDNADNRILSHSVTRNSDIQFTRKIDISQTSEGLHTLMIMVRDRSGLRSNILSRPFYVSCTAALSPEIAEYEYSIDQAENWTSYRLSIPSLDNSGSMNIGLSQVPEGLHTFNIRAASKGGYAGAFVSRSFYANNSATVEDVKAIEYAFDNAAEFTQIRNFNSGSDVNYSTILPLDALTTGLHTLNIRAVSSGGKYSSVYSRPSYISTGPERTELNEIQFAFDNSSDFKTLISGINDTVVDVTGKIGTGDLSDGLHTLFIKVTNSSYLNGNILSKPFYAFSPENRKYGITAIEYSVDSDPSAGGATQLSFDPGKDVTASAALNLTSLSAGSHSISVRAKDEISQWSYSKTNLFQVLDNNNQAPVANAGNDQSVAEYSIVTIDGAGSYDPEGSALTYQWNAPGLTLNLSNPVKPSFKVPEIISNTDFTIDLVVTDGISSSQSDRVVIHVLNVEVNHPPVSVIDAALSVDEELQVTLNGSASYDEDGNPLTYLWTAPSGIRLSSVTTQGTTFMAPSVQSDTPFELKLTVSDGTLRTTSAVTIIVKNVIINHSPVADAGLYETYYVNETVNLNGSGSSDPDGDPLSYFWAAPPEIILNSATAPNPLFTAPDVTSSTGYTFTLRVSDGQNTSLPDNVVINISPPDQQYDPLDPVSNAGTDQLVNEGTIVTLDGSTSVSPEDKQLTYNWVCPAGITLSSSVSSMPTFSAPEVTKRTLYTFYLTVSDGSRISASDQVEIIVNNNVENADPEANAGGSQVVTEGSMVILNGTGSFDPDGETVTYIWSAPAGITLSSVKEAVPTFTAPDVLTQTDLTFSLVVNDGILNSIPATVKVRVLDKDQQICTLGVAPSEINSEYSSGGYSTFAVTTECSWTAASDQEWCIVTTSGAANGTITANYTANNTASTRKANITVTVNGQFPVVVTLMQAAMLFVPVLTTSAISSVSYTSAVSGGIIASDGGSAIISRGICWSTAVNPSINDSKTINGAGTGVFTSELTGLLPGTTYHVRAYASNSVGNSYGNELTVTTSTHFVPVWWPGNGTEHMNLYVLYATIDNADLQPGDEIGVFDGDICVGMGIITAVLDGTTIYLSIRVSQDDPDTQVTDGYISGHSINYRIWDTSEGAGYSSCEAIYKSGQGIFAPGSSSSFNLSATSSITQSIKLASGWNIASFAILPSNMLLKNILDPLIVAGTLVKVQDKKGNAIEKLPVIGWVDAIGMMKITEGYKIKVSAAVTQSFTGLPVTLPQTVSFDAGWNIMGYPSLFSQAALTAFDPLVTAATLIKVQDEKGNAIEKLPVIGWIDNVKTLLPGKGYKIKTSATTSLTLNNATKGTSIAETPEEKMKTSHFIPGFTGNGLEHMNIYIFNPAIEGVGLGAGDEIGVFDGDECVGSVVIETAGRDYYMIAASLDDPLTDKKDGFMPGNTLKMKLWDNHTGTEVNQGETIFAKGYANAFEKNGTTTLSVNFEREYKTILGDAFPNPSTKSTTFIYQLERECDVRLEVLDIFGHTVKTLTDGMMQTGLHKSEWDNATVTGERAKPGIYFYRLKTSNNVITKKLIIN